MRPKLVPLLGGGMLQRMMMRMLQGEACFQGQGRGDGGA